MSYRRLWRQLDIGPASTRVVLLSGLCLPDNTLWMTAQGALEENPLRRCDRLQGPNQLEAIIFIGILIDTSMPSFSKWIRLITCVLSVEIFCKTS